MSTVGLIANPASHSVARRGSRLEKLARSRSGARFVRLEDFSTLSEHMAAFAREGVDTLFVEGGDGTLRAVLSECLSARSGYSSPPDFAVLPGGSTNLAYKVMGVRHTDPDSLSRLVDRLESGRPPSARLVRSALMVRSAAMSDPLAGFLLSTGSMARAMLFCQREVFAQGGPRGSMGVAATMARLVTAPRRTRDTDGQPLLRASHFRIEADGFTREGEHAFALMTTLPHLSLGLKPFWGEEEGAVALTHADWPIRGLRLAALKILAGQTGPDLSRHGLTSRRFDRASFFHDGPVALDGEMLPEPADGMFHVSLTPELRFIR